MGNWAALLPQVKDQVHISNAILGVSLIAAIFGAIVAIPVATYVSKNYGSGFSTICGTISALLLLPVIGFATNIGLLILAIVLLGFGLGFADISMNSQAVLCEKMNRSPTLGLFHGIYAMGALVGAICCGTLLDINFSILEEIALFCIAMIIPTIIMSCWLFGMKEELLILQQSEALIGGQSLLNPLHSIEFNGSDSDASRHQSVSTAISDTLPHSRLNSVEDTIAFVFRPDTQNEVEESHHSPSRASSGQTDWQKYDDDDDDDNEAIRFNKKKSKRRRPSRFIETTEMDPHMLTKICALCFIAYLGEGSIGDWSGIYLTDQGASPLVCTLGFVGFQVFVALGRYYSDFLVMEVGRKKLLMLSGVVSSLGLAVVVLAPSVGSEVNVVVVAIVGFSLCGLGLSVVAPSAISLAGSEISSTTMDTSQAIGYVSSVGYVGVLVGPPLLGGFSVLLQGLRWSFALDAAIVFIVTLVALLLKIKQERRSDEREKEFVALS
eukprot:CAMPEP_0170063812 /NCGR_PEP_ID=MMETSP0019_2-20121128/4539_1 /TAXON_ID=98059 /ORGANISM="Dinobryon sp., Strain UTEXLB2267" /LENGTH=494 /DNA_ID=CAMNT_0010270335 /DNA_START=81 /DNA_END=1568 /DNA_ORIENTATION=+